MCIFTWRRWSCGHYVTTSVHRCSRAFRVPMPSRDALPCMEPSESADLNAHIHVRCDGCRYGRSPAQCLLPYLDLQEEHEPRDTTQSASAEEYKQARESVDELRLELHGLIRKRYDLFLQPSNRFARKLLVAEDMYRALGRRYYSCGYFAYGNEELSTLAFLTLFDAFHGRTPVRERRFFQPWVDLESTIQCILRNSKDTATNEKGRLERLRKDNDSGNTLLRSLARGLDGLETFVKEAEDLAKAMARLGSSAIPSSRHRNISMWHWLLSLPETAMALTAGKEKSVIIRDAMQVDQSFVERTATPPETPTSNYPPPRIIDISWLPSTNGTRYNNNDGYVQTGGLEPQWEWEDDSPTVVGDYDQEDGVARVLSMMRL